MVDAHTNKINVMDRRLDHHMWVFKPRLILEAFNHHNEYNLTLLTMW
jgi:hypothetical protein